MLQYLKMAKTIQINVKTRSVISTFRKEGHSLRNIASKLKIYKGIQNTVKRFESSGCLKDNI